ncbi:HHIP-like protein 1 [Octopus bimaculoides]|uniref:Glucose/Sorbosone dehydrogenase domain-containing protein n=1 Tax=Octopus bimaculoides TaxID=37653 RepID=A0A0L8H4N2_OCTBM|nr:HHIP-like protein 1 [Octopus bimaculoides]|eukprot:XP_014775440.1 PREDICTED: HHIP-like protein 1 [Octopus bimaculoides]
MLSESVSGFIPTITTTTTTATTAATTTSTAIVAIIYIINTTITIISSSLFTKSIAVCGVSLKELQHDRCLCLNEIHAGELRKPIAFVSIDRESFLVAEQDGRIYHYIYGNTDATNQSEELQRQLPRKKKILDLSNRVAYNKERPVDERGLMSVTTHPQFKSNKELYVYYIAAGDESAVISQFRFLDDQLENVTSEEIIVMIPRQRQSQENGGQILFGADGLLYVSVGSGFGHWTHLAQNMSTFVGKILRINVDVPSADRLYSIPIDNPFINTSDATPEIYALGIKNAWRCSVDQGDPLTGTGRGRIFCGDVGDQMFEEINIIYKEGNYGWNLREGHRCRRNRVCNSETIRNEIFPISTYRHSYNRKVVIGGYVYRGHKIPYLNGKYIFGDFLNIDLFLLNEMPTGHWSESKLTYCENIKCESNNSEAQKNQYILSFGEDIEGELYMLTTSDLFGHQSSGHVYSIRSRSRDGSSHQRTSTVFTTFVLFITLVIKAHLVFG